MSVEPEGLPIYGDDGEFDPQKFLTHLADIGEKVEVKRSLRPTLSDIAAAARAFRELANASLLGGDDQNQFTPRPLAEAKAGSRGYRDAESLRASNLNRKNALLLELVNESIVAISDHLWGLIILVGSDPPLRPLLAIGRILLDAGAHVHYLLEEDVLFAERSTRAANIELESIRQELGDFHGEEENERGELKERRDFLLGQGDADGYPRLRSKKDEPLGVFAPRPMSTSEMSNLVLSTPFGEEIWRFTSSAVHARDRPLLEFISGRGEVGTEGSGIEMGIPYLGACLLVATTAYLDAFDYLGLDAAKSQKASNHLHWIIAAVSGQHDDHLKATNL